MERNRFLAIVAVVIGASAFGFLGLFTRYFMETRGLSALDTVMIRVMIFSTFPSCCMFKN